jgi:hypothetical protein
LTPARRRIPKAAIPALLLLSLTLGVQAQYVLDSIDVGGRWVGSMALNSREDVVYGRSQSGGVLFAIDCSSNRIVSRVEVEFPWYMAYSATSNKVYCTFRPSDTESLLVVDGVTHQRIRAMPLEWAAFAVWDSVANWLFVSCTEANRVMVIDCAADTVIKDIRTSAGPMRMHLNNRHRKLYVQCYDSERLNIVDLNALEVIENVRLPGIPEAGCYSEAADRYYCGAGQEVVVVDGTTDSVVRLIPVTGRSLSMVSVAHRDLVFVGATYGDADTLYVVDTSRDSVVARHGGLDEPYAMFWSEGTDLVYCANSLGDQVAVIAGNGSRMLDVLQVGDYPYCFAAAPRHRRVYLGHLASSKVYVIRDTVTGVAEHGPYTGRPARAAATVTYGSYELEGGEPARLVDIAGRPVAKIVPGVNDVRRLPPGVYAVVGRDGRHRGKVVKVR